MGHLRASRGPVREGSVCVCCADERLESGYEMGVC